MTKCDTAIDNLKNEIIKNVTKVMKKLDQKKIPFKITVDNIKKNIKGIKKNDFLSSLKQFRKIRKKSKGGRSRKGGHWLSWFFYFLCKSTEDPNSLVDHLMSECNEDFAQMEYEFNDIAVRRAARADGVIVPCNSGWLGEVVGIGSGYTGAPAYDGASDATSAVTYTASSIRAMTMEQKQTIPSETVDSWGVMRDMKHTTDQQREERKEKPKKKPKEDERKEKRREGKRKEEKSKEKPREDTEEVEQNTVVQV